MYVNDLIRQKGDSVYSVHEHDSIAAVANTLVEKNVGSVLVLDKTEQVVGILSERDLVYGLRDYGAKLHEVPIRELMTKELIKCQPNDDIHKVMSMMTNRRVRHLPVFDGDRLIGIISIGDLVKNRIDEIEAEAQHLRDYISM